MQPITGLMRIKTMITKIETEEDYREALNRFLEICNIPKNDVEMTEFELLMNLLEKYERENCSFN